MPDESHENPSETPADGGAPAATPPPAALPQSGIARIWERFKKARGAKFGFRLVVAFTLVAFFAPFIAHRLPFFWYDRGTGSLTFPLVREFFAPSDTTEPMLERGINFLFLFIPLAYLAWRLMNKYRPSLARTESRLISLLFGLLIAASLWLAIGGMIIDGGGADWLHHEQAPVPEMDDVLDPSALHRPAAGAPPELLALGEIDIPDGDLDDRRRAVFRQIQDVVEGPLVHVPDDRLAAFAEVGLKPETLDTTLDRARWNRTAVEQAYPGLLTPMRQFRGTFVAMAVISLLVLLGLTYICFAGAWQFALSPRWLALLVLGALLAQLFRLPARHDHLPYRELRAEGKGVGLFPPIPYGPSEQGFGPRQPPTWYAETPLFAPDDILAPERIAALLPEKAIASARERLPNRDNGDTPDPAQSQDRAFWAETLNTLVRAPAPDPKALPTEAAEVFGAAVKSDRDLRGYVSAVDSGRALSPLQTMQFRRLVLDKRLAGVVKPVNATRWKKPTNKPGYHLVGTDESGRDVLVRIIHGARVSLSVGFVSVFLATVLGLVMGSLAAYYGGKVDMLISRFMEIMMCFPSFFLILAVIAVLDKRSIINIMLVIGLTSWTGVARLVRGEMLRQKKMDYVSASIALGASDTRTIFRHILPNAMAPVLVSISFGITGAILTEASLSFIGFGVTPPTPTWGQLLSETRESPLANWWLVVFPGVVLFFSVLAYNFVGEALRDALDPRTTL